MDHYSQMQMLTTDVERRLRPVCELWPEDLFAALVQDVVRVKLKYDPQAIMSPREGVLSVNAPREPV